MQDHRKLRVWQDAQEICVEVYRFSADFPREERYGLTAQVRKAAVSIGANIAEGSRRTSPTDKARIFNVAQSEAAEAMSELDVALRMKFGIPGGAENSSPRTIDGWVQRKRSVRLSSPHEVEPRTQNHR